MITRDELTRIAALAGAAPEHTLRLTTHTGASIVIGSHPEGSMCADGFRALMAGWDPDHVPHVSEVMFAGASLDHGVLSRPGERLFVTSLTAEETATCLRSREDWPEHAHAVVREDALLDLAVVRVFSDEMGEPELTALADDAAAACAVEALCLDVARAAG